MILNAQFQLLFNFVYVPHPRPRDSRQVPQVLTPRRCRSKLLLAVLPGIQQTPPDETGLQLATLPRAQQESSRVKK